MAVTIAKENYPALSKGAGVSGKRKLLYVRYGTSGNGWVLVGGVLNHNFNTNLEVSTAQTKDTGYWASGTIVSKSAELSAEIMFERDDEGQLIIDKFISDDDITAEKKALNMAIVDLDTKAYKDFWCCPTSWEESASAEEFLQYSLSAEVVGTPEDKTNFTAS